MMKTLLPDHQRWAAQELATADFGDARLAKRLVRIVADKLANPTASIPHASDSWAATKATYRFLASDQVAAASIRAAHRDATRSRIEHHDAVLVLQDTTELVYTSHPQTTGLGFLDHARVHAVEADPDLGWYAQWRGSTQPGNSAVSGHLSWPGD